MVSKYPWRYTAVMRETKESIKQEMIQDLRAALDGLDEEQSVWDSFDRARISTMVYNVHSDKEFASTVRGIIREAERKIKDRTSNEGEKLKVMRSTGWLNIEKNAADRTLRR